MQPRRNERGSAHARATRQGFALDSAFVRAHANAAFAQALNTIDIGPARREIAHEIEEAAKNLGIDDVVTVFQAPAERALYRLEGPFDIVYLDPPYADPVPLQLFKLMRERQLLAPDAVVVYEHAAKRILPDIPGYRSVREEVYGDVALAFLAPEA